MENMRVCPHCMLAIESREGVQPFIAHAIDPEDLDVRCDWCGDNAEEGGFDELFELI